MSFNFEWPQFSEAFYHDAREMLAQALNKGQKPPIIADRIEVKELNMGTIPPELEILEIGDLSTDRFRGIFRLTYSGDAYIVLQTKVQANPLNVPRPSLDILGAPRILFAAAPLVVPMTLRLSALSLRAIVVLVVSRQKGITLVFKNDPLESVDVSSSFDGVESVAGFIQREIEAQLREAFRSDLPSVIHRLSQKWLSGEVKSAGDGVANANAAGTGTGTGTGGARSAAAARGGGGGGVGLARGFDKDAKIETRTAYVGGVTSEGIDPQRRRGRGGRGYTTRMDAPTSEMGESVEFDSTWSTFGGARDGTTTGSGTNTPSLRSSVARGGGGSLARSASLRGSRSGSTSTPAVRHDQLDSVPESIEAYDPTYGLRPDAIPHHAGFAGYERMVRAGSSTRGLGDVLEATEADHGARGEVDEDGRGAFGPSSRTGDGSFDFDMIGLRDLVDDDDDEADPRHHPATSYETIPAVGGGTITRPRVFHTQSQIRMRTESTGSASAHGSPSSATARSAGGGSAASTVGLGRAATFARSASLSRIPASSPGPAASVASTPRFPFPRYPHAPPPAYSAGSGSGPGSGSTAPSRLPRNQSMPSFARHQSQPSHGHAVHRSNLSWQLSASSTSNDAVASRCPPEYSSSPLSPLAVSTPLPSPHKGLHKPLPLLGEDGEPALSFTRPSPVDLLSRSPSSVLNSSDFLDDHNLPITLNPRANDSCAHLETLSATNQTLSPFTRENELVMARSSPRPLTPSASASSSASASATATAMGRLVFNPVAAAAASSTNATTTPLQPIKATRKRLHRIGSAKPSPSPLTAAAHLGGGGPSADDPTALPRRPPSSSGVYSPRDDHNPRRRLPGSEPRQNHVPNSHRKMPSLNVVTASRAPSELSDYFPSHNGSASGGGGGGGGGTRGGARELLHRINLGTS
ncbi:hypothetical protein JCM11491_000070 [Sporobolomyces phaffii]